MDRAALALSTGVAACVAVLHLRRQGKLHLPKTIEAAVVSCEEKVQDTVDRLVELVPEAAAALKSRLPTSPDEAFAVAHERLEPLLQASSQLQGRVEPHLAAVLTLLHTANAAARAKAYEAYDGSTSAAHGILATHAPALLALVHDRSQKCGAIGRQWLAFPQWLARSPGGSIPLGMFVQARLVDVQELALAQFAAALVALRAWQAFLTERAAAAKVAAKRHAEMMTVAIMTHAEMMTVAIISRTQAAKEHTETASVAAVRRVQAATEFACEQTASASAASAARVAASVATVARWLSLPVGGVPRRRLSKSLSVSRMVTGLWQVADLERAGGAGLDEAQAVRDLCGHVSAGLATFDMADHYGSAERLAGRVCAQHASGQVNCLTKWVPKPGRAHASAAAVDEAVETALARLGTNHIDLLQLHTWDYTDGAWLDRALSRAPSPTSGPPLLSCTSACQPPPPSARRPSPLALPPPPPASCRRLVPLPLRLAPMPPPPPLSPQPPLLLLLLLLPHLPWSSRGRVQSSSTSLPIPKYATWACATSTRRTCASRSTRA